ncbi:hypothetical protein JOC37_001641 [Desulfohalotomaculum tongense]|uniref:hypothetical protein n=1 Tax=Desulforadius tongensis TaxID=1216062 RepID=UPI00195DA06D|nr:hypothetical protein [Desulforadius tongensis]MBM7855248.1 hypothetical protein [Desulforadius tongensis]
MRCTIHPEKISDLSKEQMEELLFSILQHVNRAFVYNTGPVELSNRILTELIESNLLDLKGGGCGRCNSCAPLPRPKKEGKIIKFPKK